MESRKINCYYPDINSIRYRTMFNCIIHFRISQMSVEGNHILLLYDGVLRSYTFQHNDYVPVIFHVGKKAALKIKSLNLNKKRSGGGWGVGGGRKVKKVDLTSQNTQKRLPFPELF